MQVQQLLTQGKWAHRTGLFGMNGRQLAAVTPIFNVVAGRLVAANDSAEALRQSAEGARLVQRMEGALAFHGADASVREIIVADPTSATIRSKTALGRALNRMAVAGMAQLLPSIAATMSQAPAHMRGSFARLMAAPSKHALATLLDGLGMTADPNADASVVEDDRMFVSPTMVDVLRSRDGVDGSSSTRYVTEVLAHELEHTRSVGELPDSLTWLNEGGADTVARWPGVAQAMARSMGIAPPKQAPPLSGKLAYDRYTAAVRRLLVLAGFDITDPKQVDAVRALVQGRPVAAPRRFAEAIGREHGLSAARIDQLERAIRRSNGDLATITRIEASVVQRTKR